MADIKVVIQLQDTVEDEIKSLESPTAVNNASIQKTGEQLNKLSTKSNGANLKSWATGSLSLADGYVGGANTKLIGQHGYNGYVFGAVPKDKKLTVTLEIVGKYIDSIIIYGDKEANQFPTKAYRDGNPNDIIYSDDPNWAIKFSEQSTSHTLTFLEWNRADYNACITHVAELKNKLTLDKSWIKSVESLSQSTGRPQEIYYGVTPSSGNINILDIDGEIKDYIQDGIIQNSNLQISTYVNDNLLQKHISLDSEYSQSGELSLSLEDELSKLDNIKFDGFTLDSSNLSLITLLYNVLGLAGIDSSSVVFESSALYERVLNIFIPYSYMNSSSAREALDKICQVAQLNILMNPNGELKICDARPIIKSLDNVICIPSKNQVGRPLRDIINRNNYNKVIVPYNEVTYDYVELVQIPFSTYETPAFVDLYSSDDDKHFSKVENRQFSQFVDVHNTANKELTYIAFNVPYQAASYFRYSLSKFTVDKNDSITDYENFKLSIVGNSLTQLIGSDAEGKTKFWLVNSSENNQSTDVFIKNNEEQIINTFFNKDSNGKIASAKDVGAYALGVVLNAKTIDFYIFKLDARISPDTIERDGAVVLAEGDVEQLNDYTGTIIIYNKALSINSKTYTKGDGLNSITLQGDNELITNKGYTSDGYTLRAYIANNIIEDYKNGISLAKITISCSDMFNIQGNKVKDFSNGEVLNVGDIVRVDKDNNGNSLWSYTNGTPMYWRVTGRKFRKAGVPMIDLELQEVRVVG